MLAAAILGIALFFALGGPADAYCYGADTGYREGESSTCWKELDDEKRHSMTEVSQFSIDDLEDFIENHQTNLLPAVASLKDALLESDSLSVAFIIDKNWAKGDDNQDCRIFACSRPGVIDTDKPLNVLGDGGCNDEVLHLSTAVNILMRKSQKANLERSSIDIGESGFDRFYLVGHPSKGVAQYYLSSELSPIWRFLEFHNISLDKVPYLNDKFSEIVYPVQVYRLREGDSLSSVASELTGSANNWSVIWTMNRDSLENPDRVRAGIELIVPEAVSRWDGIAVEGRDSAAVAMDYYGRADMEGLVNHICQIGRTDEGICFIPVFRDVSRVQPVIVGTP